MFKKFVMVIVAVALLAAPAIWSVSQVAEAAPPQQGDINQRSITVTGYGTAYGSPDIVRLGLGVEVSDADVMVAMDEVNNRMNAVLAALQAGGVESNDIRTEYFSIWQDYYGGGPVMEGPGADGPTPVYRVSTMARITVRDTEAVGGLIEAAVTAGANSINYVEFAIEDRAALEAEARNLAVADARDRADQLAATLGLTVGEPLRVVEGADVYPQQGLGGGGGSVMEASVPPINSGQLSVSMSVQITFAVQ